ncbi:MAG: PEP-CTERM sorting domain-containing protein, partial [Opitutales bacterium]|nr:PEP-CTERM sorting domain-containing protein [Opitutales bacterium]
MGNADTVDGKVKFIVEGSGHSIKINSSIETYFSGDVDDNGKAVGGGFKFIADADGFSTVNINNFSTTFLGLIEIDFSKYVVSDTENGDEFTLISVNNNAGNLLSEIQIDLEKYFSVSGSGDYELLFGDKTLGVRVFSTNVPEPATYAAIFGALALAFAAWRRRK